MVKNITRAAYDNLYKQFGPRSGPTKHWAQFGSKLFDTMLVFVKESFEKVNFERQSTDNKKVCLV